MGFVSTEQSKKFLGSSREVSPYLIYVLGWSVKDVVLNNNTLPLEAQVCCAPLRAAVLEPSRAAAPAGFDQRESGSRAVGNCGQLKR